MKNTEKKSPLLFDYSKCDHCKLCSIICDSKIIQIDEKNIPYVRYPERCKECGHCVAICPKSAISLQNFQKIEIQNYKSSELVNLHFDTFLKSKRSVRHYLTKKIDQEKIDKIIRSGSYAPTAKNRQWVYYIVIQNPEIIDNIRKDIIRGISRGKTMLNFALSKFGRWIINDPEAIEFIQHLKWDNDEISTQLKSNPNLDPIFHNAPCLIITYAWKNTGINGDVFAAEHSYYAQTYMLLQAHALGLGSCIIGYATQNAHIFKRYIKIPKNHKIYGIFTLGYPKYQYKRTVNRKQPKVDYY